MKGNENMIFMTNVLDIVKHSEEHGVGATVKNWQNIELAIRLNHHQLESMDVKLASECPEL